MLLVAILEALAALLETVVAILLLEEIFETRKAHVMLLEALFEMMTLMEASLDAIGAVLEAIVLMEAIVLLECMFVLQEATVLPQEAFEQVLNGTHMRSYYSSFNTASTSRSSPIYWPPWTHQESSEVRHWFSRSLP